MQWLCPRISLGARVEIIALEAADALPRTFRKGASPIDTTATLRDESLGSIEWVLAVRCLQASLTLIEGWQDTIAALR